MPLNCTSGAASARAGGFRRMASAPDASTILLVNFNGTNGSTTFTDSAPSPHTLSAGGNAQISTTNPKFGSGCLLLDGTGDYANITGSPSDLAFGSSDDFCIEFWANLVSSAGPTLLDFRLNGTTTVAPTLYCTVGGVLTYHVNGADRITGAVFGMSAYRHVAYCRASGSGRLFLEGTQIGSTYADAQNYVTGSTLYIGGNSNNTNFTNGRIDGLRIKRGVGAGIYTANFTPHTSEFTS